MGLVERQNYRYEVVAFDRCDEEIIRQSIFVDTGDDVTLPDDQSDCLVIRSSIYSKSTADIAWNAVRGVRRYDIYDNGRFVINTDGRSLFVDDLVPGVDRKFRVVAFDGDGNVVDETTHVLTINDRGYSQYDTTSGNPLLMSTIESRLVIYVVER